MRKIGLLVNLTPEGSDFMFRRIHSLKSKSSFKQMPKPKIFTTILLVTLSTTVFTSLGLSFLILKATPLAQAPTPTDKKSVADRLVAQGVEALQTSQFFAAIQLLEHALSIYREIDDHKGKSSSLMNLGNAYYFLRQYQKAIDYFTQSLAIDREIGNRSGESSTLDNLGIAYSLKGQYQKAIDYFTQSLAIDREIGDRFAESNSLIGLGDAYSSLGQYQKAIDYHTQSLAIARDIGDREGEGTSLGNLGIAYDKLGQHQKAIDYFTQSLAIARDIGDRNGESSSMDNLGTAYSSLGQYQKAIDYHTQSLAIFREIGDREGEGTSLGNLGNTYNYLGQHQKAINYYTQSLAIFREIGDRNGESRSLGNLGDAYRSLGQYQKAIGYHTQSLAIFREIGDRNGEGVSLGNLGSAYNYLGQYQKAIDYHTQSLAITRAIGNRKGESGSLGNLGIAYGALGQYQKAIDYHTQSLAIQREIGDRNGEGNSLNNLGFTLYKQSKFSVAEKTLFEGIKVWESLRNDSGDNANKISIFEGQARSYRSLQQVLIAQNKITEALEISERGRARALVDLLSRQSSPNPTKAPTLDPPNLEQIKQIAKSQNATLVQYSIIYENSKESDLYIWAVKPTGEVAFEKVDLKAALQSDNLTLESLVNISREAIGVRGRGGLEAKPINGVNEKERLKQLYNILIKPIANQLPSELNAHVIFMPQAELFLVPFPALFDEGGKYLIEKHTIRIAPAIQVLQITQKRRQELISSGVKDTLVVGNPTMPYVGETEETSKQLEDLPFAESEAKAIAPLLNTKAIIGKDATKASVVQKMPTARIIHLATHGLLDDFKGLGVPGAIALAPSGSDDGLLRADEILGMKLKAELVVLSACDTGRGAITGDGVIGLSRSLISAGVPSIIVSLWSVPDAPTGYLMKEFYQNLQTNPDKAQALRQAMLKTMKQNPNSKDWAAFTLIGEAN